MVKINIFFVFLAISVAYGLRVRPLPRCAARLHTMRIRATTANENEEPDSNPFVAFIKSILRVPLEVFRPSEEMHRSRVISGMSKTHSIPMSALRKRYKQQSNWSKQDIIDNFTASFIPDAKEGEKTSRLFKRLSQLEEDDLLSSLDEYATVVQKNPSNPLEESEKFIGDAISEIIFSSDVEMNAEKVIKEPKRFYKGVPQSKLKKVLSNDPMYFDH